MRRVFLILCLAAVCGRSEAERAYRFFKNTEGQTIRAAVVSYDAAKEVVTIERDNRRTAKVPITVFCEADQTYIRGWEVSRVFDSKAQFKISVNKIDKRNEEAGRKLNQQSSGVEYEVEDIHYEILLDNRSAVTLSDLSLEYCIFYEQDRPAGEDEGVLCGSFKIDEARSKSKQALKTDAVSVYKSQVKGGYVYRNSAPDIHRGDVDGIWVRISMKRGKERVIREYAEPEALTERRRWMKESVAAGIN
jgi:hypothetical protein